jgi:hypothetical protein
VLRLSFVNMHIDHGIFIDDKRVTDSYIETGVFFFREVQFRRQRLLPVNKNSSLDIRIWRSTASC